MTERELSLPAFPFYTTTLLQPSKKAYSIEPEARSVDEKKARFRHAELE